MTNGLFSDQNVIPGIGEVLCSGNESTLLECAYSSSPGSNCQLNNDAGVACQGNCRLACILGLHTMSFPLFFCHGYSGLHFICKLY